MNEIEKIRWEAASIEEDYPGQRAEYIRLKAVDLAVSKADEVIMELSNGSVEDTDYLTSEVMMAFALKVCGAQQSRLMKKELMDRSK